jgi:phage tail-like protein
MAENSWGKQPPSGASNPPPEPNTPTFWGPAPVPPKVYTFWDEIFGEGRDAEEYIPPEGVEPSMFHESWVGGYARGATNGPLPWGEGRGSEHEQPEGTEPEGVHESWVGGDRIGAENDSFMNTGGEGEIPEQEGNEIDPTHDSWVGGDRIGAENDSFMNTGGEDEAPEQEGNEIDPAHDSWVGGNRIGATNGPLPSGAGRDSEHEQPEGKEPIGLHESWLGGYSSGASNGPLPWGTWTEKDAMSGGEGEAEERDAEEVENDPEEINPEGSSLYSRETEKPLNVNDSWVSKFNIGASNGDLPWGEGKEGSYTPPPFSNVEIDAGSFSSKPVASEAKKVDPFVGQWNFRVEIDGIPAENCKLLSVSGITMETEPIQYKFNSDAHMQSIPGRYKYGDVELTKVYRVEGDNFLSWREKIERGIDDFRNVTIHLHHINMDDKPVMSMILHDAYPLKWEFPELNASSSDGAIEKITLSVSRITRGF